MLLSAKSKDDVISTYKWVPHTKGGPFRKWFGNLEYVIAFDNENYIALLNSGNHLPSRQFYFQEGITWSRVTSGSFAVRYTPEGMVFNSACPTAFAEYDVLIYALGLMNTKIFNCYVTVLSPTVNFQTGDIAKVPFIENLNNKTKIRDLVEDSINISKTDWDSFETSWDFKKHPLI